MSVPPRTERDDADWEVSGERPTHTRGDRRPDRLGLGMVGLVLLALLIAVILLIVL
jgi:hypothetical protein